MTNDLKEFNNLSEKEREVALQILKQYSETGSSQLLNQLKYTDYDEIPVDIETFLHDKRFLGTGLTAEDGRFTVFPYWEETLKKLFPDNLTTAYNTLVLTGAIGLGKTLMAVLCILYLLHRMMCLRDPYLHYGLQPIDKISFSLINITLDAARGVAWDKLQNLLQTSPWFMNKGSLSGRTDIMWQPPKGIELIMGSNNNHVLGRAIFANLTDEANFGIGNDIEKLKAKQKSLINQVDARMKSRFMKGESLPTLNIICSSKRSEQSFLEEYIDMKRKNESKTTLIVDEPQWVVRNDKQSSKHFLVAVGNKFLDSELIPLESTETELQAYRDKGYTLLEVPFGYYENFKDDIDVALTDIAGISTVNSYAYISGVRWSQIKDINYKNPFQKEIITVGDDPSDTSQYKDFFDLTAIDPRYKQMPLFIHMDLSSAYDKTGIGGVWITGKKPHADGQPESKEIFVRVAFNVSIKAPKGRQISFEKNRQFIYWLREQGFNIAAISTDTFQSTDTGQALRRELFEYSIISVDRLQDRICVPYQTFKAIIYEQRIACYPSKLLTDEIIGLVRLSDGHIDHSPSGINSKDSADAICGACYNATLHAEQFAYDYGEGIESSLEITNAQSNEEIMKENVTKTFEQAIIETAKPKSLQQQKNNQKDQFLDFGLGAARPVTSFGDDGIFVW